MTAVAEANDARVAELLIARTMTLAELATATGVSSESIRKRVFPRLRQRGFPVEIVDVFKPDNGRGAPAAFWRIVLPKGRVCAHPGCGTVLRRTNPADRCELHGGGFIDIETDYEPPRQPKKRRCRGYGRGAHRTDDFTAGTHLCRSCYRDYRRDYNRRRALEAVS